jgi:hypothetical protein
MEITLAAVEPGQGVAGAVEFWKFELVGCSREATSGGSVVVPALSLAWLLLCPRLLYALEAPCASASR